MQGSLDRDAKEAGVTAPYHAVPTVDVDGSGVGDADEVFTIVNVHFRNDKGPVRFGDTIALRSEVSGRFQYDRLNNIYRECVCLHARARVCRHKTPRVVWLWCVCFF